ncbi:MAG TPA: hypothetical protein VH143_28270 [Kofleriaceae bacterium]|jgi:hypothetical protein|nr:hypothetical protein [Kofleriaceae bacterium]
MLTRRQLLTRGTTMLLLIPFIDACSSNNSSSAVDAGSGADAASACSGVDSTSTLVASHTHSICVPSTDLTAPPTAGVTYTSTNVGGHTHTIPLTQADLQMIESGTAVGPITSSSAVDSINGEAHTHQWTIMKT